MNRIQLILQNTDYLRYLNLNTKYEMDRKFCCHSIEHMLDVARIAYIFVLERKIAIEKELIYAASLLHDIGRWAEYKQGIPHHEAGANLSQDILKKAGFSLEESEKIIQAIQFHRTLQSESNSLADILYMADKKSRNCFYCTVKDECNWAEIKKNLTLEV